jgi:hypothetical protein
MIDSSSTLQRLNLSLSCFYFDDIASRLNHGFPSGFVVYPRDSQSRVF